MPSAAENHMPFEEQHLEYGPAKGRMLNYEAPLTMPLELFIMS